MAWYNRRRFTGVRASALVQDAYAGVVRMEPLERRQLLTLYAPIDVAGQQLSNTEMHVNWSDQSNSETGYVVKRRVGKFGQFVEVGSVNGADANSFVDATADAGVSYFYQVQPVENGAMGPVSVASPKTPARTWAYKVADFGATTNDFYEGAGGAGYDGSYIAAGVRKMSVPLHHLPRHSQVRVRATLKNSPGISAGNAGET